MTTFNRENGDFIKEKVDVGTIQTKIYLWACRLSDKIINHIEIVDQILPETSKEERSTSL